MEQKQVILVDKNDVIRGTMEKMEAHKKGELHRAFSIFVYNTKGELLLQRRAINKYHSGGLWTNTCCSHPQPEENMYESVYKRLREEMGFSCFLENVFQINYKAELDNGLIEHEVDHIYKGYFSNIPEINMLEVVEWKYMSINEIQHNIILNPEQFTTWFKIIFAKALDYIR